MGTEKKRKSSRRGSRVYVAHEDRLRLETLRQRHGLGIAECLRFLLATVETGHDYRAAAAKEAAPSPINESLESIRARLIRCEELLVSIHQRLAASGAPKASGPPPNGVTGSDALSESDLAEINRLGELAFKSLAGQMLSGEMLGKFGRAGN